jgi:hypothetical protein
VRCGGGLVRCGLHDNNILFAISEHVTGVLEFYRRVEQQGASRRRVKTFTWKAS